MIETGAMADETPKPARSEGASVGEVIEYVKTYAKQETVGPLKGAGRWIAMGAVGAIALGIGLSLLLLGVLRMLQTESLGFSSPRSTVWNYVIVLVVCVVLLGATVWRINKTFLNKEDK